ncbi:hypothetical protein [Gordonia sp. WA4-43]|uniref:hypothetical protein n=1 Tax=Gordonia sp. WA4-43 TaxID=2878678 RepID=UPI001CFC258D|nr:hypothetical protein [Gordonia sp. WA4-43]UCZ92655.1 hypothetical protein LEL84_19910 [Gordonia sp. WA4-43]
MTTKPVYHRAVGHPRVGKPAFGDGISRPRLIFGDVQVAIGVVATARVAITSGAVTNRSTIVGSGDYQVFLTTFATKRQRDQRLVRFSRHGHLIRRRDVTVGFRLDRHINRVALRQELMEPKREQRPAGDRM